MSVCEFKQDGKPCEADATRNYRMDDKVVKLCDEHIQLVRKLSGLGPVKLNA